MTPDPSDIVGDTLLSAHGSDTVRADVGTDTGPAHELPPEVADEIDSTGAALTSAVGEVDVLVDGAFGEIESALRDEIVSLNATFAQVIGSLDMELSAATVPVNRAFDRVTDQTLAELIHAHEQLRAIGVDMPRSNDEVRAELDDPTGELLMARLTGRALPQPTGEVMGAAQQTDPAPPPPPAPAPLPGANPVPDPDVFDLDWAGQNRDQCTTIAPAGTSKTPLPESTHRKAVGIDTTTGEARWIWVPRGNGTGVYNRACYTVTFDVQPSPPPPPPPPPPLPPSPNNFPVATAPVSPPPPAPVSPVPCPCTGTTATATSLPPPDPRWASDKLLWSRADVCERVFAYTQELDKAIARPNWKEGVTQEGIESRLNELWEWGTANVEWVFSGFSEDTRSVTLGQANEQTTLAVYGLSQALSLLTDAAGPGVPNKGAAHTIGSLLAAVDRAETISGFPLSYLFTSDRYSYQWANPQNIPEQNALDTAFLTDQIDADRWACLTRAHGNLPTMYQWARDAQQARPNVGQIVELYNRGKITPEAFGRRMREMGVLNYTHTQEFQELARYVPTPPDIVRFMVRDVFDTDAVREGQLDKDFGTKFYGPGGESDPGPAAKWAKVHGVDAETFKLFWRAHWELPSPTQLYEMLHRLRMDRPEVRAWDAARVAASQAGADLDRWERDNPQPIIVRPEDVKRALELNDVAPAWIDALMSVSYNPMTRTDALNAFHANVMQASELYDRLRDTGLDEPTARDVVKLQTSMRARRTANVSGVWTMRKIASAYKDGSLNGVKADALLEPLMPDPLQRASMLSGIDTEREADWRRARVNKTKRAMFTGHIDEDQATAELKGYGLADAVIVQMVAQWRELKLGRYKEITAKQVSEGVVARIINVDQALLRLSNLGYSNADANFIVRCALDKAGTRIEGEIKAQQREARVVINTALKARQQVDRQLSEREKEIEKIVKALEKERSRITAEQERRANA